MSSHLGEAAFLPLHAGAVSHQPLRLHMCDVPRAKPNTVFTLPSTLKTEKWYNISVFQKPQKVSREASIFSIMGNA